MPVAARKLGTHVIAGQQTVTLKKFRRDGRIEEIRCGLKKFRLEKFSNVPVRKLTWEKRRCTGD